MARLGRRSGQYAWMGEGVKGRVAVLIELWESGTQD